MRKKSTRILSAALAASMMLSVCPVSAFASGGGTAPDTVTAQTLEQENADDTVPEHSLTPAIVNDSTQINGNAYLITEGGTYNIENGTYTKGLWIVTSDPVVINIKGNITLSQGAGNFVDLQPPTDAQLANFKQTGITIENSGCGEVTVNGGNYTVTRTGNNVLFHTGLYAQNAALVINGGTYTSQNSNVFLIDNGTLTVKSGAFATKSSSHTLLQTESSQKITIENGHFEAEYICIFQKATAELTIENGSFTSKNNEVLWLRGNTVLNGGSFTSESTDSSAVAVRVLDPYDNTGNSLTINGNTAISLPNATTDSSVVIYLDDGSEGKVNTLIVNGGTISAGSGADGTRVYENTKVILNGGTIKNTTAGVDASSSRLTSANASVELGNVAFENNGCDVELNPYSSDVGEYGVNGKNYFLLTLKPEFKSKTKVSIIDNAYCQITTAGITAEQAALFSPVKRYNSQYPYEAYDETWIGYYENAGNGYAYYAPRHYPQPSEFTVKLDGTVLNGQNVSTVSRGTKISDLELDVSAAWTYNSGTENKKSFATNDYGTITPTYHKDSATGEVVSADTPLQDGTYYITLTTEGGTYLSKRDYPLNSDSWRFQVVAAPASADNYTVSVKQGDDGVDITLPTQDAIIYKKTKSVAATGKAKEDVTVGAVTGYQYAPVTTDDSGNETIGSKTNTPPTEPGTYQVYLNVDAAGSYGAGTVTSEDWRFTIRKPELTDTVFKDNYTITLPDQPLNYDAQQHEATVAKKDGAAEGLGDATVTGYWKLDENGKQVGEILREAPKDVGTYAPVITIAEGDSYDSKTFTYENHKQSFTISKGTLSDSNFTYNAETGTVTPNENLTGDVTADDITVIYTRKDDGNGYTEPTTTKPTIAGDYTVTYTVKETGNYNSYDSTGTYTYHVEPQTLTAEMFDYKVPGNPKFEYEKPVEYPVTVKVNGNAVQPVSDQITVHYYTSADRSEESRLNGVPTEPGTYWFDFDVAESFNNKKAEKLHPENNSFTIAKADLTEEQMAANITVTKPEARNGETELVYDSKAFEASVEKNENAVTGLGDDVTITGYAKLNDDGSVDERTFSKNAPTEPGTYVPQVTVSAGSRYNEGKRYVKDAAFTIEKAKLTADDFDTTDLNDIKADPIGKPGSDGVSIKETFYVDANGKRYDSLVNAPSGRYEIWVMPEDSKGHYAEDAIDTGRTRLVDQYQLDQRNFEFQCQPEYNYDGQGHGVDVIVNSNIPAPLKDIAVGNGITVKYYNADTNELVSTNDKPVAAGRYRYVVKVEETENNFAFEYGPHEFIIKAHTPTSDDFEFDPSKLGNLTTASTEDEIKAAIRNALTPKNGIDINDVEIVLPEDATDKGEHSFTLNVKAAADGSYSAAENLEKTEWKYGVKDAVFSIDIPNATLTDADGNKIDKNNVKAGTEIHIKLDRTGLAEDFEFLGWEFTEDSAKPEGDVVLGSEDDSHFTMPKGNVKLVLITPEPTPEPGQGGSSGDGGAAAAIIGTAAVGGAAYLIGTQVYLTNIFGDVPANRQELALALWNKADKPEPQSNVLFTDISAEAIDSQKAARWCVEQGLLEDTGETFKPQRYVTRIHSIKAWNDAKEKGLVK